MAHTLRNRVDGCIQTAEHRLKLAVELFLLLRGLIQHLRFPLFLVDIDKDTDDLLRMSAPVTHNITGGMKPTIAAIVYLQAVVHIVRSAPAEILDAGVKGGKCPLHIVRVQTRAPRLHGIWKIRRPTESDHAAELIRPDCIVDAEVRLDLHVPHTGVDCLIDRAQTEALVLQLLVHAVNQRVQLCRIRLAAAQLRKELVLLMRRDNLLNRPRKILCSRILVNHCIPSKKRFPNLDLLYHIHPYMQAVVEDSWDDHGAVLRNR